MTNYIDVARADLDDKAALFDALGRFRVLCAEREGPRGVVEINKVVGQHFRKALDHPLDPGSRSEWYPGRPVMVLSNDYVLKLFNGDVGIVLPDASDTPMVLFSGQRRRLQGRGTTTATSSTKRRSPRRCTRRRARSSTVCC